MENQNKQSDFAKASSDNHINYFLPKILWVIIVVLLFVDVIAATAWYRQDLQNAKLLTIALTPIHNLESSSSTSFNNSTWKTYTNSQYGFEFKYPPLGGGQQVVKNNDNPDTLDLQYLSTSSEGFITTFSFTTEQNDQKLSLEKWFSSDTCNKMLLDAGNFILKNINGYSTYVDAYSKPVPDSIGNDCGPSYALAYIMSSDNSKISAIYYDGQISELDMLGYNTDDKLFALFDQILSTFKFTN